MLFKKLFNYGLRGTVNLWFQSYLHSRSQYTVVDNVSSSKRAISCGVPQGSILGPILFLLYINDLSSISQSLHAIMFADDSNFFVTGDSLDELEIKLNDELNHVACWLQSNLLSLNIKKLFS